MCIEEITRRMIFQRVGRAGWDRLETDRVDPQAELTVHVVYDQILEFHSQIIKILSHNRCFSR